MLTLLEMRLDTGDSDLILRSYVPRDEWLRSISDGLNWAEKRARAFEGISACQSTGLAACDPWAAPRKAPILESLRGLERPLSFIDRLGETVLKIRGSWV
jgi:hypothetical protein